MQTRIAELSAASGDVVRQIMRMPGDRIFYMKRKAGESQFKLMLRERLNGPERLVVNPEVQTRATGVPHAINYYVPSWDGRLSKRWLGAKKQDGVRLHPLPSTELLSTKPRRCAGIEGLPPGHATYR